MAITNFIPTVWSENLYQELDKKYIAVSNCNRDFEGDIRERGDTVRICGVGSVQVSEYTKNTNMSLPATLSDTARELKIDQAKYFGIVGNTVISAHLIFLNIGSIDSQHYFHTVLQLGQHADFAVGFKSGQHAGRVIVVEQLAAKLQIELTAKLFDALGNVMGLHFQIFVVVKSLVSHPTSGPFLLIGTHTAHSVAQIPP